MLSQGTPGQPTRGASDAQQATIAVPDGIIFLLDPGHPNITVPAFEPGCAVATSPSCVSIATVPEVDGYLTLYLGSKGATKEALLVLAALIDTPTSTLAIVSSQFQIILVLHDLAIRTSVEVYANRLASPDCVCIIAS